MNEQEWLQTARQVFQIESEAVARLADRLDERFTRAVRLLTDCQGRVVVTGVGKSGAIGRKIASTLSSTGTPSLFLHAAEASHGDLGMIAPGDVLLAISYSGRTDELTAILPLVRQMNVPIIALTGNARAFLASHADIVLDVSVEKEACPLNLAPTSSTIAALAMGDALALAAMSARRFSPEDFALRHPGGTLGRSSKLRVGELMRTGERLALCLEAASVRHALQSITRAQAGAVVVVDDAAILRGYLTDGDVRRHLLECPNAEELLRAPVATIMTRFPLSFGPQMLAVDALRALQEKGVDDAPVVDEHDTPLGVLDVQELLRAGLI